MPAALRTGRRPIRIFSAGCATGEEAYTLAIIAQGHANQVEVTAFDVNPTVVKRAKEARYSTWSLRDTPPPIRQRYFETDGGQYVLVPEVRDMVRFEDRNLLDDAPELWQPDAFDIVFCRNVIMYFGAEAMRAAVARIARSLRPDGFLFMGHAETLRGISRAFHLCHTHETFYYQRKGTHDPTRISPEATSLAALPGGTLPTPVAIGLDTSWIDVIQRASERVAKLATASGPREATQPSPARADTQPILEMMREERFADALELLGTFSPTDPETQLLRAIVLTNGGRHREAERVCAELIAADELNAGAHYLLALCREHTGDGDGAREHDRIRDLSRSGVRDATRPHGSARAAGRTPRSRRRRARAGARAARVRGRVTHSALRRWLQPRSARAPVPKRATPLWRLGVTDARIEERALALRRAFDATFAAPPADAQGAMEDFLAIRIAGHPHAISVAHVARLVTTPKIVHVPSGRPAVLGVAAIRGALVSVHSLGILLGYPGDAQPPLDRGRRWARRCRPRVRRARRLLARRQGGGRCDWSRRDHPSDRRCGHEYSRPSRPAGPDHEGASLDR